MEPARLLATDLACRRGERLLFRGLSFELQPGEALQVVGPNGTGKSSLLRILAGLLRPLSGSVDRPADIALLDERLPLDGDLPLGRALAFWERIDGGGYGVGATARPGRGPKKDGPVRRHTSGQAGGAAPPLPGAGAAAVGVRDEPLNGLDGQAAADFQGHLAAYLAGGGMAVIASHQPFDVPALKRLVLADYAV